MLRAIIKNKLGLIQNPSFVTFFVTWRCNCRCVMCDIWRKKGDSYELTVKEIGDIFKQLNPIDAIRISGGEPFLRNDIHDIIRTIDKAVRPRVIHITTNGLLTDQIVSVFQDMSLELARRVHIKVSIDDAGESHDKIRGQLGAYDKAMETLDKLARLRGDKYFYLGVDQTVVNRHSMDSYIFLKEVLKKLKINIHPVIAYDKTTGLYSEKGDNVSPDNSYKPYGKFTDKELRDFLLRLLKDSGSIGDFKEKVIKKYYLKGLYNRLVKGKKSPDPTCVALNSHIRILPNGNMPVCMYNPAVVGKLRNNRFVDIWQSDIIKKYREWVKKCSRCWVGCETNINAIYTGDIYRGMF